LLGLRGCVPKELNPKKKLGVIFGLGMKLISNFQPVFAWRREAQWILLLSRRACVHCKENSPATMTQFFPEKQHRLSA
jgi:hypothetical protein